MPRLRPVSQYSSEPLGIATYEGGVLTDPDGLSVTLGVRRLEDSVYVVANGTAAVRDGVGLYSYKLNSSETATKGAYLATWAYNISSHPRLFEDDFRVTDPMPYWDNLSAAHRDVVMNVYYKVKDTFDSREGGPYLWELYQTQWNAFETIARLMTTDAMDYINFVFPPAFIPPFGVGDLKSQGAAAFPVGWTGLLARSTYVSFLRHISRSYIEIPVPQGVNVARLDRTGYRQAWKLEHDDEKDILDPMIKMLKRKYLLGFKSALIVGGGNLPMWFVHPTWPQWQYVQVRF